MNQSPGKAAKRSVEEAETIALLRRVKRLGVREVDFVQTSDGQLVLQAKVQRGRAHQQYATAPHDDQLAALQELAAAVGNAQRRDGKRRKGKPTAKRVERPEAGKAHGPVDERPLADRMDEMPPAAHAARAEPKERPERVKATHRPDRAKALPAGRARKERPAKPPKQDRPGRGGGR